MAGSSDPLPSTVHALHFYRENISALSSLVDSRRIVHNHAVGALSNCCVDPLYIYICKYIHNLTPAGFELQDQQQYLVLIVVAFGGNHQAMGSCEKSSYSINNGTNNYINSSCGQN